MAILIDGYNLLHVTGIFAPVTGPGSLQKLHEAFVQFLARTLEPAEAAHTEVVFDSKGRHSGARRMFRIGELIVHYSSRDEDADTYLADLIAAHSSPRRLVVVSSDHQVQRAARRRRAKPIDSHVWYAELMRSWHQRSQRKGLDEDPKPPVPLSPEDVSRWLEVFQANDSSDTSDSDLSPWVHSAHPLKHPATSTNPGSGQKPDEAVPPFGERPASESLEATDELFPASYLEAIERELLAEPPAPKSNEPRQRNRRRKR